MTERDMQGPIGTVRASRGLRGRRLVAALTVAALAPLTALVAVGPAALAQTSDLQNQLSQTDAQRRAAEQQLADVRRKQGDARTRYAAAEREVAAAQAELDRVTAELAAAEAELAEAEDAAAAAEAAWLEAIADVELAEAAWVRMTGRLESRVVAAYKYGQVSLVEVVAGSRSLDELIVSSAMVANVVDGDRRLVVEAQDVLDQLTTARERAEGLRAQADAEVARAEEVADRIEAAAAEQQRVTGALESRKAELAAALKELQQDEKAITEHLDALAKSAAEIERRLRAALEAERGGTSVGDTGSGWLRPTDGWLSSGYGYRVHPVYGTVRLHAGVDLASPTGTPIRASKGGTVTFVGWMSGYGQTVIVYHGDGLGTLYAHLSRFDVPQGSYVAQGTVIGAVGMTGTATGPHLHFEVRVSGSPRNPCDYIRC
jgi:murein DD-endopeptidase MepM/ murein hydrolase activator NlpD